MSNRERYISCACILILLILSISCYDQLQRERSAIRISVADCSQKQFQAISTPVHPHLPLCAKFRLTSLGDKADEIETRRQLIQIALIGITYTVLQETEPPYPEIGETTPPEYFVNAELERLGENFRFTCLANAEKP